MLSSQPLCFTVFGHLQAHPAAAARVLSAVLPWTVHHVESVLVEHAPAGAKAQLGDRTAFDAMVVVRTADDQRMLLGFETKYTEPFTRTKYEKSLYVEVTEREGSWFTPGTSGIAAAPATNQLWRNLMLAQESTREAGCTGAVVVLSAAEDTTAMKAVKGMETQLASPGDHLQHVLLEDLMAAAQSEPSLRKWSRRFSERYLDTSLVTDYL